MLAKPPLVFFCHVPYGIGHWTRSAALITALQQDFRVTLLIGGRLSAELAIPEGIETIWLPAKYRDEQDRIVAGGGLTLREATEARARTIQAAVDRVRPMAVVVEYFPFGHWETWAETLRLIETAKYPLLRRPDPVPPVICSLRDIQQTRRPYQEYFDAQVCEQSNALFDAILVHSDPCFARFEETFAPADQLRIPVLHTGFVAAGNSRRSHAAARRGQTILVSAGGGLAGESLLLLAIEGQRSAGLARDFDMRVIAGVLQPEDAWERLRSAARGVERLELIRWVPDLQGEMAAAAVSVSRCGYNTALDVLRSGVRALFVPYATPQEDEQTNRAERLSRRGLARYLQETDATPDRLAREVRETASFEPARVRLDFEGAARSVLLIKEMVARRGYKFENAASGTYAGA